MPWSIVFFLKTSREGFTWNTKGLTIYQITHLNNRVTK